MRERITFIQKPENLVDPSSLKTTGTTLRGPLIDAAREERVTLALDELPTELRAILGDARELHFRWVGPNHFRAVEPLFSRLSPGLHVFYTPLKQSNQESSELCILLKILFGEGLDCISPRLSFTALPNDRFTHSTAFQYYQPLEDLSVLIDHITDWLCPKDNSGCPARAERLQTAGSFDISWDVISHALKATALWPEQKQLLAVDGHPLYRTEVGLLAPDSPATLEPHELGVSGHLVVLDGDSKPSATLFTFPSRHKHSDATFSATFLTPTGLHPTLQLRISSPSPPPGASDGSCALHTYLTLPRQIFADRYQLGDGLFLGSKNLTALRYASEPVDLEAPDYAVKVWGSAVLLELQPPAGQAERSWTAEVPLHLRYLAPASGGYEILEVPFPVVFWACTAEEGTKFPTNPFEKVNLGYDGLFGPRTVFWHVDPEPVTSRLMNQIHVPVLDTDQSSWINAGTSLVVIAGSLWLLWKLASVYLRMGYRPRAVQAVGEARDKKRQ